MLAIHGQIRRDLPRTADEAFGAKKDVTAAAEAADVSGLARMVARLEQILCVKG